VWVVPNHINENCVLRLRYNISTDDYMGWDYDPVNPTQLLSMPPGSPGANASLNGRDNSPVTQDPYIYLGQADDQFVSLKVNTNQYGRTFQDRSYVFAIRQPNTTMAAAMNSGKKVYNLNVRGKRGNIVEVYPSVEYDFVPDDLNVAQGELIHFQWTGSDYNPRRGCNDATGGPPDANTATAANQNSRADRSNIVPIDYFGDNFPSRLMFHQHITWTDNNASARPSLNASLSMFQSTDHVMLFAFIKQDTFLTPMQPCFTQDQLKALTGGETAENHPKNCAKLNAAFYPYFDGGVIAMNKLGTWGYYCSRNNNFSNRDQTGRVCVYTAGDPSTCTGYPDPSTLGFAGKAVLPPQQVTSNIIKQETFAFNTNENDAMGDGEKMPCQGLTYSLNQVEESTAVGVALGMIVLGAGLTLISQFAIRAYLGKPKGLSVVCLGDGPVVTSPGTRRAMSWGKKQSPPGSSDAPVGQAPPPPPKPTGFTGVSGTRAVPPPPPAVKPTGSDSPHPY